MQTSVKVELNEILPVNC